MLNVWKEKWKMVYLQYVCIYNSDLSDWLPMEEDVVHIAAESKQRVSGFVCLFWFYMSDVLCWFADFPLSSLSSPGELDFNSVY